MMRCLCTLTKHKVNLWYLIFCYSVQVLKKSINKHRIQEIKYPAGKNRERSIQKGLHCIYQENRSPLPHKDRPLCWHILILWLPTRLKSHKRNGRPSERAAVKSQNEKTCIFTFILLHTNWIQNTSALIQYRLFGIKPMWHTNMFICLIEGVPFGKWINILSNDSFIPQTMTPWVRGYQKNSFVVSSWKLQSTEAC